MCKQDHSALPRLRASGLDERLLAVLMAAGISSRTIRLLPFDIPTLIIADDPQLLAAARAAYAYWSVEAPFAESALELRLEIGPASSFEVSFDISVEGSHLRIEGQGIAGTADAVRGLAHARVPASIVDDPLVLTEVIDTLLLFLAARRGRTPVHAAAFMVGEVAVVLAGPSGSGKSTLALAAALRGLSLLSDDTVFVQLVPAFALWGFPRPIHVFPKDSPAGEHPTRVRNRKLKRAVEAPAVALKAERSVLALLEPGDRLAMTAMDPDEAVRSLMHLEPGFDLLATQSRQALEALAASGPWRLTLEKDPAAAVALLAAHFGDSAA